ncbi:MAG: putative glycosyl transferase [Puniceicoccaceae bacterium 5H]|nr:MAG: putative glycosyl transferase [Puniceicoccaceae bacterium 5H]
MRTPLNWFSPLPAHRTDIANYTARVLPALIEEGPVTLWSDLNADHTALRGAEVRQFHGLDLPWPPLNYQSPSIYQVGNDGRFHRQIVEVALRQPGVLVLHDLGVHDLLRFYCLEGDGPGKEAYIQLVRRYAGNLAAQEARETLKGERPVEDVVPRYPMFEWLTTGAWGVIVHNPENLDRVAASTRAPVWAAPLPYWPQDRLHPVQPPRAAPQGRRRLLLFGFLHSANRRLQPILEALATFPRRDELELTLAGEYPDAEAMPRHLQEMGLSEIVHVRGFLSEGDLRAELDAADLVLNLRWPSLGEASGTLLRVWDHARPALVTRTAFYATLPEEVVAFVDPKDEQAELHRHFSRLLDEPAYYARMGEAGRAYLERHHTAEAFARGLRAFREEAAAFGRIAYPEKWGESIARRHLARLPATTHPAMIRRLSEVIEGCYPLQ